METNNKLLTVVVPVYKVEQYIRKCLGSLILPDDLMKKIEVLVVNDGTPDRSADMARDFEKRYPDTYRIIDKENGGHGSAWNRGLKEAKGKYLRFLDSDDWFDTNQFKVLVERLQEVDADIIISNYNRFYLEDGRIEPQVLTDIPVNQLLSAETFDWNNQTWDITNFWRCTYRTAILKPYGPLFVEHVFYDDVKLIISSVILSKTLLYLDLNIYNYLLGRPGQTMAPDMQRKYYLHKFIVQKDLFDFYLSHPANGDSRNAYLKKQVGNWLLYQFYQLSRFPYSQSKKYLKEWSAYYQRLSGKLGYESFPLTTIRLYFSLPFFLFYYSRKIKDQIQHNDTELGISEWAR